MGDNNKDSLGGSGVVDEVEDAFGEWDETVPVPARPQPAPLPFTARTATRSDPLTTGLLAEASRRTWTRDVREESPVKRRPGPAPESLEEAIRSLMVDDVDDDVLDELDVPTLRFAASGGHARH